MDEIEKEGYNLNISRYISTATSESEIDLAETHKKLVEIEGTIVSARAKHNQFLKSLGCRLCRAILIEVTRAQRGVAAATRAG